MSTEDKFFYANGVEIAVSPFDINLKFLRQGTPDRASPDGNVVPERLESLVVGMSPVHAKAMLTGLQNAVSQYEGKFGGINTPQLQHFRGAGSESKN